MNKYILVGEIILGGLLLKVIHNQEVLDSHIERYADGGYISWEEQLEYNNLRYKIRKKIYKIIKDKKNK